MSNLRREVELARSENVGRGAPMMAKVRVRVSVSVSVRVSVRVRVRVRVWDKVRFSTDDGKGALIPSAPNPTVTLTLTLTLTQC